jgi:hypothetical protein
MISPVITTIGREPNTGICDRRGNDCQGSVEQDSTSSHGNSGDYIGGEDGLRAEHRHTDPLAAHVDRSVSTSAPPTHVCASTSRRSVLIINYRIFSHYEDTEIAPTSIAFSEGMEI